MTTAIYTHPLSKMHEMGPYSPERPERVEAIEKQLVASGTSKHLEYREAPEASIEDIQRIHLLDAINMVRESVPEELGYYYSIDGDTQLNPYTWLAALRAAGAGIAATDAVIAGEIDNAFCLMRPIGHHATRMSPMGFCIFNNLAIAAMRALKVHKLERIALVDFDVHHGNGTEEAFAFEPSALMVSFFQSPFYPYTGTEKKRAHMVNVPVPAGTGGDEIRRIVTEQWLPALHAHSPEMIFISAGFDAHRYDAIGGLDLVEDDYAWITHRLMEVAKEHAKGRIVSFLEGGYSSTQLAQSATAHIRALAGLD